MLDDVVAELEDDVLLDGEDVPLVPAAELDGVLEPLAAGVDPQPASAMTSAPASTHPLERPTQPPTLIRIAPLCQE